MKSIRVLFCTTVFVVALLIGVSAANVIRSIFTPVSSFASNGTLECSTPQAETSIETEPILLGAPTPEVPPAAPNVDTTDTRSPYEIQYFIDMHPTFNVKTLWERLGISNENRMRAGIEGNASFFSDCTYCKAQLDGTNVGDFGDTVLLRIENAGTEECRYLLFKREDAGSFKLLGFIDHGFGRYEMPRHRWIESNGRTFLVVRVQTASGSGVAMYADRLFTMRHNRLIEVLEYPGEGHYMMACSSEPGMEFFGKIDKITGLGRNLTIHLMLDVRYLGCSDNGGVTLGTTKRRVVYRWSAKSGRAIVDSKASNLTKYELQVIHDLMG